MRRAARRRGHPQGNARGRRAVEATQRVRARGGTSRGVGRTARRILMQGRQGLASGSSFIFLPMCVRSEVRRRWGASKAHPGMHRWEGGTCRWPAERILERKLDGRRQFPSPAANGARRARQHSGRRPRTRNSQSTHGDSDTQQTHNKPTESSGWLSYSWPLHVKRLAECGLLSGRACRPRTTGLATKENLAQEQLHQTTRRPQGKACFRDSPPGHTDDHPSLSPAARGPTLDPSVCSV